MSQQRHIQRHPTRIHTYPRYSEVPPTETTPAPREQATYDTSHTKPCDTESYTHNDTHDLIPHKYLPTNPINLQRDHPRCKQRGIHDKIKAQSQEYLIII